MKISTWNINSVRLRIALVMRWIDHENPDVICLQETKTPDEFFPVDAFLAKGFSYHHFAGMKGYNGVCIFSKFPLDRKQVHRRCGKDDMRHISASVKASDKAFELHNIYIPAGGYEPDLHAEKFKHKLDFIDEVGAWFLQERSAHDAMVAVGDFNVAPLEHDVWDHKKMLNVVSHTPIEVEKFQRLQGSLQWHDAIRHFVPETEKLYSWWSYRAADWDKADKGRRLDHIWVTPPLQSTLRRHSILRTARGWTQPSDHVPITVELANF